MADDDKPVWLLDVDGVINASTAMPDTDVWPQWRTGWAAAVGSSWPITWAPPVVDAINRLFLAGRADIRWLTTWLDEANDSLGRLVGLPELPVVPRFNKAGAGGGPHGFLGVRAGATDRWWKLAAARRLLDPQPHRPLVWTDDDLVWEADARVWAEQRQGPTLLVAPATDVGLTAEHLTAIDEFCADPWS